MKLLSTSWRNSRHFFFMYMTTLVSKAPQTGSPNCHTQHVLEWYIYKNNHVFFGDLRTQDVLNLNWDIWEVRCLHWATVCATSSAAWFRRHLTILCFTIQQNGLEYEQESMPASQGFKPVIFIPLLWKAVCGERNQGKLTRPMGLWDLKS